MEHLVIGTAGHVDHGKTELVKVLTGYETDRLKEEQLRGMTIELGFAPFYMDKKLVSIVDVPGHEKLIKTMVSGASGMDMALLIIAADEGIMPQTIEHIHILSMLNISTVIIVITKIDLVSAVDIQDVKEKTKKYMKDTLYEKSPICTVSSKLNVGIKELKDCILAQAKDMNKSRNKVLFRMPVDRVFTMKGYGTVVTGTIASGKINKEESIEVLPSRRLSRVRGIQVHGSVKEEAFAGQRCAINLNRMEKSSINRGDVITKLDEVETTMTIDAVIYNVLDKQSIKHNQKVKIIIGTKEVIGQLRMVDSKIIRGKEKGYVRIRLKTPIVAIRNDRFIIRSLTPLITIGGGKVLAHKTAHLPRHKEDTEEYYRLLEEGTNSEIILYIMENDKAIFDIDTIFRRLYQSKQFIWKALSELVNEGKIIKLGNKGYISKKVFLYYEKIIISSFDEFYEKNRYSVYMSKEALRSKHFSNTTIKEFDELMRLFIAERLFQLSDGKIVMDKNKRVSKISEDEELIKLEKLVIDAGLRGYHMPKGIGENVSYDIIHFLEERIRIRQIDKFIYIHSIVYEQFLYDINRLLDNKGKVSVIEVRDELKIGRKQTIILLEYLDQQGITKRIDNYRIINK